jgi:peptidoglycan-associated lipoprotein
MSRFLPILILSTLFYTNLLAQPLNRATPQVMLKTAEEQLEKQDPFRALEWFEKYYEETKDAEIIPQIARLNMQLRDYKKAERYYGRYLKEREGRKKKKELSAEQLEDRFDYGRALKVNEKFDEAIVQFEKYADTGKDPIKVELAENEIAGARLALQQGATLDDGKEVAGLKIEAIKKVNSKEAEYGPFLYNDELYYASFGDVDEVISTDGEESMAYAQIYKASKKKDKWEKGEPLDTKINREDFQTTHPHISPDGEFLYFTRSLMRGNVVEISNIYFSEKKGDGWAGPNEVAIGFDDQEFRAFHPCVGDLFGKEVLFFVSDMPGGVGGRDIYYATKKGDGVYGEPVNLASINTAGDEATPFYRNGTLYFSSNGLPGYGGYDLFTSVWDGTRWSKPDNMGRGYNTPLDEKSFFLDKDGINGFLTSNRSGRGIVSKTSCFDIYSIVIPPVTANVLADVFVGKRALKGATVALLEMVGQKPTNPKEQTNKKANNFDFPLNLEKTYMLIASREGYSSDTATVTTLDLKESTTFKKHFDLKKLKPKPKPDPKPAEPEYEEIEVEINQPIRLSNIYYEFNDDKILIDAEKDLSVILDLMQRYPDMVIELSSHTDARGGDDYNEALSQRRADSATRWLIEKGIAADRIKSVGYGEKMPATVDTALANEHPFLKETWVLTFDLISKLSPKANREAAHQINRRTEFRIIEGPTNIKIKKMEKRLKKPAPKVITKPSNKKKRSKKKKSRRRNANPQGDIPMKNGPKMIFDYSEVDFGTVTKGEKREHTFKFVNKGDEALKIEFVSACDCTTLEYSKETVEPGKKGEIKAVFDSSTMEKSEKMDIDIILENVDPKTGYQIIERVSYTFKLVK